LDLNQHGKEKDFFFLSKFCFSFRESFSNNVITFCRQYGFDGIDLDWEFPSADHRERFGLLTKVFQ
jgi:GH18 family chitinase